MPAPSPTAPAAGGAPSVPLALLVYCVAGTLLTLANKLAVAALPAPNALLIAQNGATVALLLALTRAAPGAFGGPLPPLTAAAVRAWLPLTLLFVGMLASSLLALQLVSAVTLIVFRNLCTLVVAFFERAVLGAEVGALSAAALLGILLGAVLYALSDLQFSAPGYAWLLLNVACTAAFQIYVKALVSGLPKEGPGALGPFGMSYYNNLISLPVFAALAAATGELPRLPDILAGLTAGGWAVVAVSALLGFALSTSAFLVNGLVSATSMMVANNVNKFALIILSEVLVEHTLGPVNALGTALVMLFAWVYAQSKGAWASYGQNHDIFKLVLFVLIGIPAVLFLVSVDFTAVYLSTFSHGVVGSGVSPSPFDSLSRSIGSTFKALTSSADRNNSSFITAAHLHAYNASVSTLSIYERNNSLTNSSVTTPVPERDCESCKFYRNFIPALNKTNVWTPTPGVRSDPRPRYYISDWGACPRAAQDPGFKRICNVEAPCSAPSPPGAAVYNDLPRTTAWGESVHDVIQRTLRAAWGPNPPQIDLYLRAGCGATTEIAYLLPTIELFWPAFLGEVIIALDAGNEASLDHFIPSNRSAVRQSYRFVYEDVPCLPGRILNQVSYLNADLHSQAEYIVTIDSDCAFHSPVTCRP